MTHFSRDFFAWKGCPIKGFCEWFNPQFTTRLKDSSRRVSSCFLIRWVSVLSSLRYPTHIRVHNSIWYKTNSKMWIYQKRWFIFFNQLTYKMTFLSLFLFLFLVFYFRLCWLIFSNIWSHYQLICAPYTHAVPEKKEDSHGHLYEAAKILWKRTFLPNPLWVLPFHILLPFGFEKPLLCPTFKKKTKKIKTMPIMNDKSIMQKIVF